MIFAYTVKGYGLATEGHPQNHSSLLTADAARASSPSRLGTDPADPWARFPDGSAEAAAVRGDRRPAAPRPGAAAAPPAVPADLGRTPSGTATTQAALGRALLDLTRAAPGRGGAGGHASARTSARRPTSAAGSTRSGCGSPASGVDWFADDPETILHWRERPTGQHLELGIAETNLVGLLGELGATWSRWGQPLLPIGVLYDPFVERALEPWSFGIYAGGQSILVGTPSGVTLAPEGGAHQSITTPSVGLEQPGCITYEPAFAIDVEWTLLAVAGPARPPGRHVGLPAAVDPARSTRRWPRCRPTRPPGSGAAARSSPGPTRCAAAPRPRVTIAAMGAMVPEALAAADRLAALGHRRRRRRA